MENALRIIEDTAPVSAEVITFPGLKAPVKAKRKAKVGGFVAHKDYVRAYETKTGVKFNAQVRLNGKQASKSFATRAEADTWAAERVAEFMKGTVIVRPENIKLPALFTLYIEDAANNSAPLSKAILSMYRRLSAHPVLKDVLVANVKYETALNYCKARKAEGVGPATILSEFVRVAKAIRDVSGAREWGIDPLNEFVRARLMKAGLMAESNERTRRPSEDEKAALRTYFSAPEWLAAHDNVPMTDIIDFAMISGFRRGEIVTLERAARTGNAITAKRKDAASVGGKREALVPVFRAAWEILDRQPAGDLYFPYNADTISGYFTEACAKLGIVDLCFHDLRHEAISTFGTKMNEAQAMMVSGHKTAKSFRRYLNLKQQDAEAIVALIG